MKNIVPMAKVDATNDYGLTTDIIWWRFWCDVYQDVDQVVSARKFSLPFLFDAIPRNILPRNAESQ